ncbi:putative metal-dependent phosphoesterase, PHP family [Desulfosporosinus orientis DSM 765]|uniref:Putative metal-dependent phosphoesterase, PHP family n=1 Tax=Desulfosporosinus orientis (strain ATCC 19365 / DSM 765 / NCIMB 8382 / VKM B-1628 / Singapore I) TaxID=768706 RepID=G7WG74_DESOD|nr:metal-dependent phosphoesterase PHP family [Desulfosporosinus orientis]AET70168.1 putative metal-dependent phosphoesterase, PHP family [Desulfosporosinus orientis DSM 765]
MKTKTNRVKIATLVMSMSFLLSTFNLPAFAANIQQPTHYEKSYTIVSPYKDVDWKNYGQYKADFHAHSTNSDGGNFTKDMVEDHYKKGYDILAMTDHNYLTKSWDTVAKGAIDSAREAAIVKGDDRSGKGMIDIYNTDEQSKTDHINSFFADFNNSTGATMASTIETVEKLGGITHINHPGRYTGGASGGDAGLAASNNPTTIQKYVDLFTKYPSCIGMEIINKIDNESRSDRILWDNILKDMMPNGRFVWGFSNDDTHSINATGYSWNVMLMPSLSQDATRTAMETGAFYAVSRVSRRDNINAKLPNGNDMPGSGTPDTLYLLNQTSPSISNIVVNQKDNSITITGQDYNTIEWVADGDVIATGTTLDLNDHENEINTYVRAQLKSSTGIAFTQPFGVKENKSAAISITSIDNGNNQANVNFDIHSANGKGYVVCLSDSGNEGTYAPYSDVNYDSKGAHIKGLENKKYYAYVMYVNGNTIAEKSEPVLLNPGK